MRANRLLLYIFLTLFSALKTSFAQTKETVIRKSQFLKEKDNAFKEESIIFQKEENVFDNNKNIIQSKIYVKDSNNINYKLINEKKIKYNTKNKPIEEKRNRFGVNGIEKAITINSYTPNGQIKRVEETIEHGSNPVISRSHTISYYSYYINDSLKTRIDSTAYYDDFKNNKFRWEVYGFILKYNDKGQIVEKVLGTNPSLDSAYPYPKYIFNYSSKSDTLIYIFNSSSNFIPDTTVFIKDNNGNYIKTITRYSKTDKTFDAKNRETSSINLTEYIKNSGKIAVEKSGVVYNNEGKIITSNYYYNDKNTGVSHKTEWDYKSDFTYNGNQEIESIITTGFISYIFEKYNYKIIETYSYESDSYKEEIDPILVFPNPTSDVLNIVNKNTVDCLKSADVFNLLGQKVLSIETETKFITDHYEPNPCNSKLSLNTLTKGFYIIKIETIQGVKSVKRILVI
jgi:hypothetical protein